MVVELAAVHHGAFQLHPLPGFRAEEHLVDGLVVDAGAQQRRRHSVRPGLTGLAQCSGRNNMTWDQKFEYDLEYIKHITFWGDLKIILMTAVKVFKRDGITEEGMATAADLGDYLLDAGRVSQEEYEAKQAQAKELLGV